MAKIFIILITTIIFSQEFEYYDNYLFFNSDSISISNIANFINYGNKSYAQHSFNKIISLLNYLGKSFNKL